MLKQMLKNPRESVYAPQTLKRQKWERDVLDFMCKRRLGDQGTLKLEQRGSFEMKINKGDKRFEMKRDNEVDYNE